MSNGCCEYRLEEMSWPRAQAAIVGGATAVVPVGSLEQHGRHLALNTDERYGSGSDAPLRAVAPWGPGGAV